MCKHQGEIYKDIVIHLGVFQEKILVSRTDIVASIKLFGQKSPKKTLILIFFCILI